MTAMLATQLPVGFLEKVDRCDRCGAQAVRRVILNTGQLLFCGHHSRTSEQGLQLLIEAEKATVFDAGGQPASLLTV